MKKHYSNAGFTLIEVIIALLVLGISLLGFFQVSTFIVSKINTSDYRISAMNYGSGGIEIVRGIRDNFLKKNPLQGWDNNEGEIDSFVESLSVSENGHFILEKIVQEFPEDQEVIIDYTLKPLGENVEDVTTWEKVFEEGFLVFYRKIQIEEESENLRKITVSVHFDDGTYSDTIFLTTYLGNIAVGKNTLF